jgi:hypothetical protein
MTWNEAKTRTEVIAPWITILGLLAGGLYTLVEYRDHQRERRLETTSEYVKRFMENPLSDHRATIAKQWSHNQSEIIALLSDKSVPQSEINRNYEDKILTMIVEGGLAVPIQETILFFEELAHCVTLDLCDGDAVSSMLSRQGREFFRQHYPYVCHLRKQWNDDSIAAELEAFFNPVSVGRACVP